MRFLSWHLGLSSGITQVMRLGTYFAVRWVGIHGRSRVIQKGGCPPNPVVKDVATIGNTELGISYRSPRERK